MDEAAKLRGLAQENLDSARDNADRDPPRLAVAFAEGRQALELACKVALLARTGSYPRKHEVAGAMVAAGAVPKGVEARRLDRILRQFTRGEYGEGPQPTAAEVQEVIQLARKMLDALS